VFARHIGGAVVPLILSACRTVVVSTCSGSMAMAVNCAYRRDRINAAALMFVTAGFGEMFVGMQAFEWSKLILEGVRPWGNPMGAPQFGSTFFMINGFHGLHVTCGVIYLMVVAIRLLRGKYERAGSYQIVEIVGLYWHFVDLVWVFIFAFFYLW
jgi:cytochrome c oxidase subunit 3